MATSLWETGPRVGDTSPEYLKWRALMDKLPPLDRIRRNLLPSPGEKPPVYHYGFPFTRKYALNYARRHHLTVPLAVKDRDKMGGRPVLDFADLDDALLESDRAVRMFAATMCISLMIDDLSRKCDFPFDMARPFSDAWDGMVSLWSNYDVERKLHWCEEPSEFKKIIEILTAAMNETDDHKSLKAQWWFDWDNESGPEQP
ncbi:hypothetical protein GSI_01268 [Ganoderma sinense ZZ0214-1]|uniref:Uncharacterized protein n=1 Tax=Ganoderma sinense ZZ0214-1 TaxID=1077348 RepID=A0A2G8SUZ0_9APHY|nr:hypothetical protein GSI_01268 [Ganoderma sinense ZZ0214-1]